MNFSENIGIQSTSENVSIKNDFGEDKAFCSNGYRDSNNNFVVTIEAHNIELTNEVFFDSMINYPVQLSNHFYRNLVIGEKIDIYLLFINHPHESPCTIHFENEHVESV